MAKSDTQSRTRLSSQKWSFSVRSAVQVGLILLIAGLAIPAGSRMLAQNLGHVSVLAAFDDASWSQGVPSSDLCSSPVISEPGAYPLDLGSLRRKAGGCLPLAHSRLACYSGDLEQARVWYEAASRTCDRSGLLLDWGGQLAWAAGDRSRAMEIWSSIPGVWSLLEARAYYQWHHGDREVSQYLLEVLLPDHVEELAAHQIHRAFDTLAESYAGQGDLDSLLRVRREAVEYVPERAANWIRLGEILRRTGELEESLRVLEHATSLAAGGEPFFLGWACAELGYTQAERGHDSEALLALEAALDWYGKSQRDSDARQQSIRRTIAQLESSE